MEFLVIGTLFGLGAATTMRKAPNTYTPTESESVNQVARNRARDLVDGGDVYHVQGRSLNAVEAGLNSFSTRYAPYSAPRQDATHSWAEVAANRAENTALVERDAPRYMFDQRNTLGIAYGAPHNNATYNLSCEVAGVSFPGDPGYSIARLPKVFNERYSYSDIPEYTTWHFKGDGEPTVLNRAELPNEADVMIHQRNPYGPFGYYQSILRNRAADETRQTGNVKPGVLRQQPPIRRVSWNIQKGPMGVLA